MKNRLKLYVSKDVGQSPKIVNLNAKAHRIYFDLHSFTLYKDQMQQRGTPGQTLSAREVKLLLAYFPKGIVAFDLETTGLSPVFDKIIEIAAVKLLPSGKIEFFHELINPLIEIPPHTIQFHQITNDMVRELPGIKQPLKSFVSFFKDLPLLAHNSQFDAGFMIRSMHEFNIEISSSEIYDSCRLGRKTFKKFTGEHRPENFKLSSMATYFDLELSHHQALDDAIVCLRIFANCIQKLELDNVIGELKNYSFLYRLDQFKKDRNGVIPAKFLPLKDYLYQQTPIMLMYKGGQHPGEYRPIKPLSIMPLPQGLMLYGQCLLENKNKHFSLSKIKNFKEHPDHPLKDHDKTEIKK